MAFDKCPIIKQVIDMLQTQIVTFSASQILAAYDHLVAVHGLCKQENKIKKFIMSQVGECKNENCAFLAGHTFRRREFEQNEEKEKEKKEEEEYGLNEIIGSTLNALHTHCLHSSHSLFRLLRQNGKNHFVSSESESSNKEMIKINFGESIEGIQSRGGPPPSISSRGIKGFPIENPLHWADSECSGQMKRGNAPAKKSR